MTSANQTNSLCPLTSSEELRETANQLTASIKDSFPPGVSQPALRTLAAAGYTNLDQLSNARAEDLQALHGMEPKAMGILQAALEAKGKSLKLSEPNGFA